MNYQPPHEVTDTEKLQSMIDTLRNGGFLPAIYVSNDVAYSGSHRLAAWEEAGVEPAVIEFTDEEISEAMVYIGLEPGYDSISDYEAFENALTKLFVE